jgi:hypothetical protein
MAAMKEAASFAQRATIPRQRLRARNTIFNDVPCLIQLMAVRSLLFPAFNRRDDCCYIRFLKHAEQFVRVMRLIRMLPLSSYP